MLSSAVEGFSQSRWQEAAGFGIKVTLIEPGGFSTDWGGASAQHATPNPAYDAYREKGTTYWGHYGPGDGIVDYPLTLEKVIVERRTHVIAGTELVLASPDDVLLGGVA